MRRATAVGVGWSKIRVGGSRTPVTAVSRLRSSTAVTEVTPSSVKAVPAPAAEISPPVTAASSVRTSSVTRASASPPDSPASRPARSGTVSAARPPGRDSPATTEPDVASQYASCWKA